MTEEKCGSTDTASGEPCGRDAGFGTDRDHGPCYDHENEWVKPKKLTPKVKQRMVGALREGAHWRHAAAIGGITEETLRLWRKTGKMHVNQEIDSRLADLYLEMERARGEGALQRLHRCSDEFVLARSFGYTEEKTVEHREDRGAEEIDLEDASEDQLEKLIEVIDEIEEKN